MSLWKANFKSRGIPLSFMLLNQGCGSAASSMSSGSVDAGAKNPYLLSQGVAMFSGFRLDLLLAKTHFVLDLPLSLFFDSVLFGTLLRWLFSVPLRENRAFSVKEKEGKKGSSICEALVNHRDKIWQQTQFLRSY